MPQIYQGLGVYIALRCTDDPISKERESEKNPSCTYFSTYGLCKRTWRKEKGLGEKGG